MTGSDAGTIVTVEVLVEQQIVPPVRIALEYLAAAEDRAPSTIGKKDARQSIGDLFATSNRFIRLPEPVGHSILKLSP